MCSGTFDPWTLEARGIGRPLDPTFALAPRPLDPLRKKKTDTTQRPLNQHVGAERPWASAPACVPSSDLRTGQRLLTNAQGRVGR